MQAGNGRNGGELWVYIDLLRTSLRKAYGLGCCIDEGAYRQRWTADKLVYVSADQQEQTLIGEICSGLQVDREGESQPMMDHGKI